MKIKGYTLSFFLLLCVRLSTSSCIKAHWNFSTTKETANPSGLSAILLWRKWTPWTPWKVNDPQTHTQRDTHTPWPQSAHSTLFVPVSRWCWARMGRDHDVRTNWGTPAPEDEWDSLGCDLCTDPQTGPPPRDGGSKRRNTKWTTRSELNNLSAQSSLYSASCLPIIQKEWEKQKGDKEFQKQQGQWRNFELTVRALSHL